ncbi:MAG: DUF2071 domain-containing protein [Phycisphaerales bacterium]
MPISAWFEHCLVLTYSFPEEALRPLLPPGLAVDTWNGSGFVAIAMVQTKNLRPSGLPPSLGCDFFLTGYRIFSRYKTLEGRTLRGLRILRSDTDSWRMVLGGNLLTHYHYRKCSARVEQQNGSLLVQVETRDREADVIVEADIQAEADLPEGSIFSNWSEARRFAGPLPFTFDFEKETNSIVRIKGIRQDWNPRAVRVNIRKASFVESPMFGGKVGKLASAFYAAKLPYRWERGIVERLKKDGA